MVHSAQGAPYLCQAPSVGVLRKDANSGAPGANVAPFLGALDQVLHRDGVRLADRLEDGAYDRRRRAQEQVAAVHCSTPICSGVKSNMSIRSRNSSHVGGCLPGRWSTHSWRQRSYSSWVHALTV